MSLPPSPSPSASVSANMALYSWPPNPTLISLQLLLRSILLLVNMIGVGLCFGTAANYRWDDPAAAWVSGSFQSTSLLVLPWLILWNHRIRRRVSSTTSNEKQPERHFGTKILQFCTFVDAVGFVAYVIVYGIFMATTTSRSHWNNDILAVHATVTVLICFVVHGVLFVTQALQLRSAKPHARYRCPNCNSSMESFHSSLSEQTSVAEEAVPGQETGTCERTPRVSEASSSKLIEYGKVNEQGERESDTLLEQEA